MGLLLRVYDGGIEVVRETTDAASGASARESIGWAELRTGRLSPEAVANLSADEIAAITPRLRALRTNSRNRDRADAFMLHADINRVRVWAVTAEESDIEAIAEDLMFEMQELRRTLIERLGQGEG